MAKGKGCVFPSLGLFSYNIKQAKFLHRISKDQKTASCGLALFSVFSKGLLECHHLQQKKKEAFLGYVVLLGLTFPCVPKSTSEQDVSAIPSEAGVGETSFRCPSVDGQTILLQLKPIFFFFSPPVKELWSLWLAVCTHCFAVDLTTPQACKSQTGRSKEE